MSGAKNNNNVAPVTVVIPCFNCRATIERAVNSVIVQSILPASVIVVDDCSQDGTAEILQALSKKYADGWMHVIELPRNRGPGNARNVGWDAATQPYVAFLDADDAWHERKIAIQLSWMQEHPEVSLTGHLTKWVKGNDAAIPLSQMGEWRRISSWRLLLSNCFSTRSIMLNRNLPTRFDPDKRHMEDYAFLLDVVFSGHIIAMLDIELAYIYKADFGAGGLSEQLWKMEVGELRNYWRLRTQRRIGTLLVTVLSVYSLLKYARRVMLVAIRRLRSLSAIGY